MESELAMLVLIIALVAILFALLILVAFGYLLLKTMQKAFGEYEHYFDADPTITEGTPDPNPKEIPLENFTPDFKKEIKIKYAETEEGLEEIPEGDDR